MPFLEWYITNATLNHSTKGYFVFSKMVLVMTENRYPFLLQPLQSQWKGRDLTSHTFALPQRGQLTTPSGQRRAARYALQSSSVWNRATSWAKVRFVFMTANMAASSSGVKCRIIALARSA